MTAVIIPFRPREKARASIQTHGDVTLDVAVLEMAGDLLPMLRLAYEAVDRGDIDEADYCLGAIISQPVPADAPMKAVLWREGHINKLIRAIEEAESRDAPGRHEAPQPNESLG